MYPNAADTAVKMIECQLKVKEPALTVATIIGKIAANIATIGAFNHINPLNENKFEFEFFMLHEFKLIDISLQKYIFLLYNSHFI
jgi:hypothetical protein